MKAAKVKKRLVRTKASDEETILRLLTKLYPKDHSSPGFVTSCLPSGLFYASVVRYDKAFGEGKQVLVSATKPTLQAAKKAVMKLWMKPLKEAING